jgi:hypothetical protein
MGVDRRSVAPDHRQLQRRVSLALAPDQRSRFVDLRQVGVGQLNVCGANIFFESVSFGGAWNGDDGGPLPAQPG